MRLTRTVWVIIFEFSLNFVFLHRFLYFFDLLALQDFYCRTNAWLVPKKHDKKRYGIFPFHPLKSIQYFEFIYFLISQQTQRISAENPTSFKLTKTRKSNANFVRYKKVLK